MISESTLLLMLARDDDFLSISFFIVSDLCAFVIFKILKYDFRSSEIELCRPTIQKRHDKNVNMQCIFQMFNEIEDKINTKYFAPERHKLSTQQK